MTSRRLTRWAAAACLALVAACGAAQGGDAAEGSAHEHAAGEGGSDTAPADDPNAPVSLDALDSVPDEVVCDLGTMYPGQPLIDPDAPDFEDEVYSKQQVAEAFAADKAKNGPAYRAYKAALVHQDVLECAFCACGCAPSIGHLSAIDCFKDMHGFG